MLCDKSFFMSFFTVIEAAKLVRKSIPTIYRHIKNGKLSKTPLGIDKSELLRVYGVLYSQDDIIKKEKNDVVAVQDDIDNLKKEIEYLKLQFEKSQAREDRLLDIIENRLPAPETPKPKFKFW